MIFWHPKHKAQIESTATGWFKQVLLNTCRPFRCLSLPFSLPFVDLSLPFVTFLLPFIAVMLQDDREPGDPRYGEFS